MPAGASMARRCGRCIGGLLLHALVSGLPAASAIILLVRLFDWGSFAVIPGGPATFAGLFIVFAATTEALVGGISPRLYRLGFGRICFDGDVSLREKFERLRQEPQVWPHLLTRLALVSLLAITVLSIG
jgi:hypothetical protein